jgi:aminotransferase
VHGYAPFAGHPSLREAIAERYAADHGVMLDPEREVAVVPGTKTGITLVALAAAGEGDVVLLPDPGLPRTTRPASRWRERARCRCRSTRPRRSSPTSTRSAASGPR